MCRQKVATVLRIAVTWVNPGVAYDDLAGGRERNTLSQRWTLPWGGHPDDQLKNRVVQGVQMLKASGADVILMDLQYAPMVLKSPYYSKMEAIISEVARQEKIGFFSRFALMRKSIEAGVSPSALVSWDGLHHTADGYDCIGRALARSVSNIVR
jgi:acyl-CoA thioesterase I